MMKRTLGLSRALSEQTDNRRSKARGRNVIRLGSHDFPAGQVFIIPIRFMIYELCSSVKTFADIIIFPRLR